MEDGTVVDHDCRKTIKLICGMEGKIVVAYGRLPSPPRKSVSSTNRRIRSKQRLKPYFVLNFENVLHCLGCINPQVCLTAKTQLNIIILHKN